jgi:hypothetical protein
MDGERYAVTSSFFVVIMKISDRLRREMGLRTRNGGPDEEM